MWFPLKEHEIANTDYITIIVSKPKYPGIRITTNGNQLVSLYAEARFRQLIKRAATEEIEHMEHLVDVLLRVTQQYIVYRRYNDPDHQAYIPDFGAYIIYDAGNGKHIPMKMSRQMVLFNV